MRKPLRESAQGDWYSSTEIPTSKDLQFGALQRIADATEAMTKNHTDLMRQNDWLRTSRNEYLNQCERLKRQLAATKGAKTKLRNELERLKANGGGTDGQTNPAAQGPASRQG